MNTKILLTFVPFKNFICQKKLCRIDVKFDLCWKQKLYTLNESNAEPIRFERNPKTLTQVIFFIGYIPPDEIHSTLNDLAKQLLYFPKNFALFLRYPSSFPLY